MGSPEKNIGSNIRRLRQKASLSQAQLAERVDVSTEMVSRLERGVSLPGVRKLADIASVLGAELPTLFEESQPNKSKKLSEKEKLILAIADQLRVRDKADVELARDVIKALMKRLG